MKIKMYLFPDYVTLEAAEMLSENFFNLIKTKGADLETARWDGHVDSIPEGDPAIVRASSLMRSSAGELAEKCAQLGYFVFYNDTFLDSDGKYYGEERLLQEAERFISYIAKK